MPSVFVPGRLVNPLNGAHGHWSVPARYRRTWREKVHVAVWAQGRTVVDRNQVHSKEPWRPASEPKRITLHAHTWGHLDPDGLAAACKPILDGLVDAGLIHSDAPDSGHEIAYSQEINRKKRGVHITWEARGTG